MTAETTPTDLERAIPVIVDVKAEFAAFSQWWANWRPDKPPLTVASHIFDAWLACARHRARAALASDQNAGEVRSLVIAAFEAGCLAVHQNYHEDRDPDFTEAAIDYANHVLPTPPQPAGRG